jgi:hypothetical protein
VLECALLMYNEGKIKLMKNTDKYRTLSLSPPSKVPISENFKQNTQKPLLNKACTARYEETKKHKRGQ